MAQPQTVRVMSGGRTLTFALDWESKRWSSDATVEEGEFPLVAELSGKRYELYSDGSFDEEELRDDAGGV